MILLHGQNKLSGLVVARKYHRISWNKWPCWFLLAYPPARVASISAFSPAPSYSRGVQKWLHQDNEQPQKLVIWPAHPGSSHLHDYQSGYLPYPIHSHIFPVL